MSQNTRDLGVFFRPSIHPQKVKAPLQKAPPLQHETRMLEDGKVIFEKDIAIPMRDQVILYADLYRPSPTLFEATPTLILFAPFGKHGAVPRNKFENMGVDFDKLSHHTHWELPDPLRWCGEWGFSFLLVDPRGTWWSEGAEATYFSPEEGRDGYDIVEWVASQSWSDGNVGWGGGVSYYAMSAYQTAVLRPPHLRAIMVWEGISDIYREVNCPGGIPGVPFQHMWMNMTGNGLTRAEDHAVAALEHPLLDDYWRSKIVKWSDIDVPAFFVTGWSSLGLHLRGTIGAWREVSSASKYLQIHGGREWSEFYKDDNVKKQKLFWDRFLKNIDNEVTNWPPVEIDARYAATSTISRGLNTFPPVAELKSFWLDHPDKLTTERPGLESRTQSFYQAFRAHDHKSEVHFDFTFRKRTEISGNLSATLYVQAINFPDVDIFVALQKIDKAGNVVKFYHSTQKLEADAAFGWLRASHRELDQRHSTLERPVHLHERRLWLNPDLIAEICVEIWPTSTIWEEGETMRLAIKGTTFTDSENVTQFRGPSHSFGEVRLWYGRDYESRLIVPVV